MKVEILSKDYDFRELESIDHADMGRSSVKTLEILISKGMPRQGKEATLLHEIMHQVADQLGIILDECVISALATGLYTCSAIKILYPTGEITMNVKI